MRADRPLRVPLQLGTSSLSSLVLCAAWFVPGTILVGVPATVLIALEVSDLGDAGGYIFLPGMFACGMAWKYLVRARAQRPSDLELTGDGFVLHGGPHAKRRVRWADLGRVTVERSEKKKNREEDDSDLRQLCVYGAQLGRLELAAAERPGEQRSLAELARTLEAGRGAAPELGRNTGPSENHAPTLSPGGEGGGRRRDDATALLVCPSCAAAVGPADAATVVCPYCQATVPVGDDVRRRLRDAADVARRPDAAVAKLLDQPGAGFVSVLLGVGAAFMLTAWPLALVVATLGYFDDTLTLRGIGFLALFVVACVVGFFGVLRGRLVDRQALRLVALDFGAIPPRGAGLPYLCRRCHAPLAPAAEQVLVTCVYCQSDNVLGIDLRRDAQVAREESQSLAQALARRTSERRRWRGVSLLGVALLALSGWSLRQGFGRDETTWPLQQQCDEGSLPSCLALAELLSTREPRNLTRAVKLAARACDGELVEGCVRAAALVDDEARASELRARACKLGHAASCR